ncbi:uncharacterized protein DUF3347 [Mucilaginibacter gracilis]|uniref:Uncharacterized protein DUF3347 n=1 Tax=Mucilaginibacter gracilis TaxID=423350 RepID=A0A495J958_9SPHI|nr:DUF3347 domain-containing protein [Mucilaginibacter gracilis]RKR84934.1 uncharacterized protein DUF3347 [Mucilaginibacter gracilis]
MKTVKYLIIALLLSGMSANAQTATVNTSFNHVLKAYLGIKDALVADNSKLANSNAKEFAAAVKEVGSNQLDAKQKTIWLAYGEKLRFDGEHISESDKLAHQREHFTSLSKNMLAVVKAFKSNTMVIYAQYCPMKKATWLSQTAAIHNPYYGKDMDDCGTTKETIKAN